MNATGTLAATSLAQKWTGIRLTTPRPAAANINRWHFTEQLQTTLFITVRRERALSGEISRQDVMGEITPEKVMAWKTVDDSAGVPDKPRPQRG